MLHLKVCNIFIISSISEGLVMQLFLFVMDWKMLILIFSLSQMLA